MHFLGTHRLLRCLNTLISGCDMLVSSVTLAEAISFPISFSPVLLSDIVVASLQMLPYELVTVPILMRNNINFSE